MKLAETLGSMCRHDVPFVELPHDGGVESETSSSHESGKRFFSTTDSLWHRERFTQPGLLVAEQGSFHILEMA